MDIARTTIEAVKAYRHKMRLAGRWGACFEVSCFVEHHFGWRRRDGVYQLPDGAPVFKHAWNETGDGCVFDGAADQFFMGRDVDLIQSGDPRCGHYRESYTVAHNPGATDWLAGRPWIGEADDVYWDRRRRERALGPGWWLKDDAAAAYRGWLLAGAERYPLFRAKAEEYRSLGYHL